MGADAAYDDLVHSVYDAALEPEMWPEVLGRIAGLLEATSALLFTPLHSPADGGFLFTVNIPAPVGMHHAPHSCAENSHAAVAIEKGALSTGAVVFGDALVPLETLRQTHPAGEFPTLPDTVPRASGMVLDGSEPYTLPTALTLFRGLNAAPFDAGHVELLERLVTHLSRAFRMAFQLRDARLQLASSVAVLDSLASAVMLLGHGDRITYGNPAAKALLEQGNAIVAHGDGNASPEGGEQLKLGLHPALRVYERRFQAMVARVSHKAADACEADVPDALVLPDGRDRPAYVVHVVPLHAGATDAADRHPVSAVMFVHALSRAETLDPDLLAALFDLTSTEARTAVELLRGGGTRGMATRMGISENTLKTHLKAVYAKCGMHRQVDLLRLLLSLIHA